jgi:hypothetical protein
VEQFWLEIGKWIGKEEVSGPGDPPLVVGLAVATVNDSRPHPCGARDRGHPQDSRSWDGSPGPLLLSISKNQILMGSVPVPKIKGPESVPFAGSIVAPQSWYGLRSERVSFPLACLHRGFEFGCWLTVIPFTQLYRPRVHILN